MDEDSTVCLPGSFDSQPEIIIPTNKKHNTTYFFIILFTAHFHLEHTHLLITQQIITTSLFDLLKNSQLAPDSEKVS